MEAAFPRDNSGIGSLNNFGSIKHKLIIPFN